MKLKLLFATQNEGKLKEVKKIFNSRIFQIISLNEYSDIPDIIEDADTFEGNAVIKAKAVYEKFQIPVIADDSGLVVEQLNGEPGIHSARYAGENSTYPENNKKLVKELQKFSEPHLAKFICCAVFYDGENIISTFGELKGKIIHDFKGQNGFGYDPIFVAEGYEKTLAEISFEEKNKISHRAEAFKKLEKLIEKNFRENKLSQK